MFIVHSQYPPRCYSGYHGNILVCLLRSVSSIPVLSTVISSAQCFYFHLLLFAALLGFTKVSFERIPSRNIHWHHMTNTKIKGFCFSWKNFFMFRRWVFRQSKKRLKTVEEMLSNNEVYRYSLMNMLVHLEIWVGFRRL